MKKLLCVICCIAAMCFNGINVSAGSNDTTETVDYMGAVKGLITTSPDTSVFTQKSGVKYGEVKSLTYYSQTAGRNTPVNVILPPNYTSDREYPVLYILHGFTDTQDWMLRSDVALVNMLGNLISSGEAKEMIVVLPYIFCSKDKATCTGGINKENSDCYDNFINDLKTDLMNFIEQSFPVAPGRENTAITGFSMGGRESLFIGINMSDIFGYVGAICPAPGLTPSTEAWNPGQFQTTDMVMYDKSKGVPYLTFIGKGQNDRTVNAWPTSYHDFFIANGNDNLFCEIPGGGHNATSVKPYLYNYLRMIFKTEYLNSPEPTEQPTATPTVTPTEQPTATPTVMPTVTPTTAPTTEPAETPEPYNYPYKITSTDMSGGTVTLRIEKSDNALSAQVIFAEYDKGTLMNVQIEDVSSDENKSFSKTFEYSGEDYKAFIWDAAGTMTPLAESADHYGRHE